MGKSKSPVKQQQQKTRSMEEIQEEMNSKLSILTEKLEKIEAELKSVSKENSVLKTTIQNQEDQIAAMKDDLNIKEQYTRLWSVRILNVRLPPGQESDTKVVMNTIYNELFLPILRGAAEKGEISSIPSCLELLETAHILPGKGSTKPIIARFFSRYWRSLIFRYRREYAPKEDTAPSASTRGSSTRQPRPKHSLFEDLTTANFKQLQSFKQSDRIASVWSVNGVIRFKVKDCDTIFKVSSLYDTVESIIE
jgi:predicted transcriptional regulator